MRLRLLLLFAVAVVPLMPGAMSSAAIGPEPGGAVITSKAGKTYVIHGARCAPRGLHFGTWRGNGGVLSMKLEAGNPPGSVRLWDGFIDLRSARGVYEALSGSVYVNADGRSGRLNVWGRSGGGWESRTGHRWRGTWRCA